MEMWHWRCGERESALARVAFFRFSGVHVFFPPFPFSLACSVVGNGGDWGQVLVMDMQRAGLVRSCDSEVGKTYGCSSTKLVQS